MAKNKPAEPEAPKPNGRPTLYNQELAEKICLRMSLGESVMKICRDEDMPCEASVRLWNITNRTDIGPDGKELEGFSAMYARARQLLAERKFEEIEEVAKDGSQDYIEDFDKDGKPFERVNHEHIARSRLIVDTLKWQASKLAPKQYGDKVQAELSGPDGKDLPQTVVVFKLPDNERDGS